MTDIKIDEFLQSVNRHCNSMYTIDKIVLVKFCVCKEDCNYCAKLVYDRTKVATCSLAYWYDKLNEPEPKCKDIWLIQDWYDNPVALVRVTDSYRCLFSHVGADFAFKEGEGDRSLLYWQNEHRKFFEHDAEMLGVHFDDEAELSLQEFEVLFLNEYWCIDV